MKIRWVFSYVAMSNGSVANVLQTMGQPREALPNAQRALQRITELDGPEHPGRLRILQLNGVILERLGRRQQAISLLREALRRRAKVLGVNHAETAGFAWALGRCFMADPATRPEAEQLLLAAWRDYTGSRVPQHPVSKQIAATLAAFYHGHNQDSSRAWTARAE